VDKMFTIFPFETAFYAKHKFPVEYVGNPTVDSVCTRPNQEQPFRQFCVENNLTEKPIIAILAGSRKQEIVGCLPRMIEAGLHFANDYQVVIAGAPSIEAGLYNSILKERNVSVVYGKTYELLQQAKVAVVNSGTATLETALVGTPEVVVYHVPLGRFGYLVKEIVVRTKFVSLVNIVAEKLVVKELLAHLFTVENIVAELELILKNETYRKNMLNAYAQMRKLLGEPGAAERAAKKIVGSF
ncbi:MAG TPA: lipid-A-disaccharide synthase, partial [Paludibacter sp.]|nr:lipid-A-disaccharide synthase [Paludibacter sp.]